MDYRIFLLLRGGGSPQPTPVTHDIYIDFPFTWGDVEITGPGTYTQTLENEILLTLIIDENRNCELKFDLIEGAQMPGVMANIRFKELKGTGNLVAGKKYRIYYDIDKAREDELYMTSFQSDIFMKKHSDNSNFYADYKYVGEVDEETFEYSDEETLVDCTSLSEGDYYYFNNNSSQSMIVFGFYGIKFVEGQPVYITTYTAKFALAFDEVPEPNEE